MSQPARETGQRIIATREAIPTVAGQYSVPPKIIGAEQYQLRLPGAEPIVASVIRQPMIRVRLAAQ